MALRAVFRIGSVVRTSPQVAAVSARGFANFDERERGEEVYCSPISSLCLGLGFATPTYTPDTLLL